jgi:aminoglycoside/choline kinase family phosphotransferase
MLEKLQTSINQLFTQYSGCSPSRIEILLQSGSNRRYFRIIGGGKSVIGVAGTSEKENIAFVKIAQQFENQGIPAPKVLAVSDDFLCYLQTDLGNKTLFDELSNKELLHKTIAWLPDIQFKVAENFDFSACFPQAEFDRKNVFFDLNYFKYCFLKLSGIEFDEVLLENDFEKLAEILLQLSENNVFMYRDFQSRNVMIVDNEPYFIDFQGGRKGTIYYDVASFLWQAKANFPDELRNELIDTYLYNLKKYLTISKTDFLQKLRYFVLFRQMQVLGAYGFRGIFEQKQHFLQSMHFALENIKKLLPFEELPYLSELFSTKLFQSSETLEKSNNRLTVQIESFAYKNGIPKDNSENGGGYLFDCRAIYNPGRFEEYKKLTGLDAPVKEFIENSTNINEFLQNVYSLIDKHIEVFLERNFWHISVFFGCTGGQHRSVYCAEALAKHVLAKYPVDIRLKHRELSVVSNTP